MLLFFYCSASAVLWPSSLLPRILANRLPIDHRMYQWSTMSDGHIFQNFFSIQLCRYLNAPYWRHMAIYLEAHVMTWCPTAPSHFLNHLWLVINWTFRNKIKWNLNRNTHIFFHDNSFENIVCNLTAILCRLWRVKSSAVIRYWHAPIARLGNNSTVRQRAYFALAF